MKLRTHLPQEKGFRVRLKISRMGLAIDKRSS